MKKDNRKRHSVTLGALLHDIGKFVQRANDFPGKPKLNHAAWGVDWFQRKGGLAEKLTSIFSEEEKQIIRSAISNHHPYERYISLADAISAGMDRVDRIGLEGEEKGDPFAERMISIFSRASISDKPKVEQYHTLKFTGQDPLNESFPVVDKKCTPKEYTDLLNSFEQEITSLDFVGSTISKLIDQLYFLLWKYTWCIPSAVYRSEPDVSLFDHLKTTAAIAGCLYDYQQENPEPLTIESTAFRLIGGDISGIQNYIFDVLTQQGKVAKRLRARSLFVQLISEIAAHRILHQFELPLLNILSSAGGNFYLLVPNVKDSEQRIHKLQAEFDEWTFNKLNGELSINLAGVAASGEDLKNFGGVLEELKTGLRNAKQKPHRLVLVSDEKWEMSKFIRPELIEGEEKACPGCRHYPVEDGQELCRRCSDDRTIGEQLPKKKYLAFYNNGEIGNHRFQILDYAFEMWDEQEQRIRSKEEPYLVLGLNTPQSIESTGGGFKYIATHIPTEIEGIPSTFDQIADKSQGDRLLGYVKADVDNMGEIFRSGFKKLTISRFCSLSRMLETFFAGYIQMKLKDDFNDIYTVFSGGDDFFVVGPWNKAIDFVQKIRDDFRKFTAGNPDFTLSAGIILAKSHEPISFCAEHVENELKKSKSKPEKDSITLFHQTVAWDKLNHILDRANKVIRWLKDEPPLVSRGFINDLRIYGEMSQKYNDTGETKWLKFVPLLASDISRNLNKDEQEEPYNWAANLSPTIEKPPGEDDLPYLRVIMEYVLTYTRGGKGE